MSAPRILVVRFSAIGDCIMVAWPVSSIRKAWPDSWIAWAVQMRCSPVIDTARLVDSRHIFPRERWKGSGWSPTVWREKLVAYGRLRRQRLDYGFDFQGHSKTAMCLRLANPKVRLASRATDAFARRLNRVIEVGPGPIHEVELGYRLVRQIHDFPGLETPIMPEFGERRREIAAAFGPTKRLITVQTGAGESFKTYPAALWAEVVDRLAAPDRQIVAIGGPDDPKIDHPAVIDRVGVWGLPHALAAVAESSLHLAADTGTGHAAAAYGTPVVSVFGPTDPAIYRPWGARARVLKHGDDTACVSSHAVAEAALELLEGEPCGT